MQKMLRSEIDEWYFHGLVAASVQPAKGEMNSCALQVVLLVLRMQVGLPTMFWYLTAVICLIKVTCLIPWLLLTLVLV